MAKRLNRLLAALAATAALAAGITGTAWAGQTADGKVPLDVKATDGTTLDGSTINLYKVGEYDSPQYDKDGQLAGIHAASTDTDDKTGFTVGEDGTRTAITAHGKAAKAAKSAGVDVDDGTDPLDVVWQSGPSDSKTAAFARAYANELADAKTTPDGTLAGAGTARVQPGVYVITRGTDADTAVLAGTAMADGGTVEGRADMGSASLTGTAVTKSDDGDGGLSGLLRKAGKGVLSLFGMDDGVAVQDVGGSAGVNGYGGGGGGSGMEWRWWFQDTENRDGDAKALAYRWSGWNTTNPSRIHNDFDSTCDSAKRNAMARYGHEYGYYRIVAVGSFIGDSTVGGGKTTYHGNPGNGALRRAFWSAWNAGGKNEMKAKSSDRNGYLSYVTSLADAADGGQARIACVVLGQDQPTYHFGLNLTTQAQSTDGYDASQNKWNYKDGGYDGSKQADYGGIEHDTRWVRDRIDVTATENDADFSNVVIETHLRVDEDGDHKIDHEQVITEHWGSGNGTVKIQKGQTVPFWTKPFNASGLSNWGKPYWPKGHLWFDTWVKCAPNTTCGLGDTQYYHYGDGNNQEEWYRTPTNLDIATKAGFESDSPTAGGTQRVRDRVSITPRDNWWLPDERGASEKGDYKGPVLKSWLHYRSEDGKTVKDSKMKTTTITDSALQRGGKGWVVNSTHTLDTAWYTPEDLGMKSWQPGTYWFDAAVDVFDVVNSPLLSKTYWDHVGKDDAAEQFTVSTTALDLKVSTKADGSSAKRGGHEAVRDSVTLSNSGKAAAHVAKATVTLNYPGLDGGVKSASKTITDVTVPAGGSKTVSSPEFTPADLGMKNGWQANLSADDHYWFDVGIDPADVTDDGGNAVTLASTPSHDGRTDENERFVILYTESSYSTKAADTFARSGGAGRVHDDITLDFDEVSTLNVTSTLNYAADVNATKADSSKAKAVTLDAKGTSAGPGFAPSDFGWKAWKAGRYWYDLTIPAQTGNPTQHTVSGLAPQQSAERWTAANTYLLDLAKRAYIGQPGSGRWDNEPVKGAAFTVTETTDQTGDTAVAGATPRTVTTDANGSARLVEGTIGATGTRWFKVVETATPDSYGKPGTGTYWMVKVTGTADGATVTVSGADKTAQALLKGVDGSTVTLGNRFQGNIMPPLTGGTYDVMRAAVGAGAVMLAALAGGVMLMRRRNAGVGRHAR